MPLTDSQKKMFEMLEARRDLRKYDAANLQQLLEERSDTEANLSKTAREALATFSHTNEALANEALVTDFLVGGFGFLITENYEMRTGLRLGTCELWYRDELISIRTVETPLSPVFLLASDSDADLVPKIRTQAQLFMKGVVSLTRAQLNDYRMEIAITR